MATSAQRSMLTPPPSAFVTTPRMKAESGSALTELRLAPCSILKRDTETMDAALLKHTAPRPCNLTTLAAAISENCSSAAVQQYLQSYPPEFVSIALRQLVEHKHPLLFYAAEKNSAEIVRILLESGADAEARDPFGIPTRACTIMRSKATALNPLEIVKTLVAHGAQPHVVPVDMWVDYMRVPSVKSEKESCKKDRAAYWCKPRHRQLLCDTLHLSLRYYLHKATQITPTLARGLQIARAHNYMPLLKTPYLIIDQHYACKLVVEQVSSHIGMKVDFPLVLTFAGLSGHGKTELATKMGQLLGVPLTTVDCSQMRTDTALLGPRPDYAGNAVGSQLNKFLALNDDKRSVVFLDEFDKTDQEIRHPLLLVLDSGQYHERRNNKLINCTKSI